MSQLAQFFQKRPAWKRLYDWDFSNFDEFTLTPVETGITNVIATILGPDNTLVLGSPAVNGMKVQMTVAGGTAGQSYTVIVQVNTVPSGYILDWAGQFQIVQ